MSKQVVEPSQIIPFVAKEFEYDSTVTSVSTSDVVNLFSSIAPEFGEGTVSFAFDNETSSVWIAIPGVSSQISVVDIDPFSTWDASGSSDVIAIRAIIKDSAVSANDLSRHHSFTKFYQEGDIIIAEEPVFLTHGIAMLNLLDRLVAFLTTINTIND